MNRGNHKSSAPAVSKNEEIESSLHIQTIENPSSSGSMSDDEKPSSGEPINGTEDASDCGIIALNQIDIGEKNESERQKSSPGILLDTQSNNLSHRGVKSEGRSAKGPSVEGDRILESVGQFVEKAKLGHKERTEKVA